MNNWFEIVLAVFSSVLASSGLWAFLSKKAERKDRKRDMLIGLAHDRILSLGMFYIERGWITSDEYENLCDYLYKPYRELGGNGSAVRVMAGVDKLEIRSAGSAHGDT
jgi:hypothetical protein